MHAYRFVLLLIFLFVMLPGCSESGSEKISSAPRVALAGFTQNFDGSRAKWRQLLDGAQEAGVASIHLQSPRWAEAEAIPGSFDLSYFDAFLQIIDDYSLGYSIDIATPLGISEINVPADVVFSSFDDPALFSRYQRYVRAVLGRLNRATEVVLHTETAGSFFESSGESKDFLAFCDLISKTANLVRETIPGVRVGIYGTKNESREILECLNRSTDFFGMGYIADRGDDDHLSNLSRLASLADGKSIAIIEAGVPTSPRIGGSERAQLDFIATLRDFTSSLGAQLLFVSYYQFIDDDEALVRQFVPTLFPSFTETQQEELIAFLSSLGLHRADGTPKPAWSAFKQFAKSARSDVQ